MTHNDKTIHPLQQCLRDNGEQIAAAVTEAQFREVLAVNTALRGEVEKLKQDSRNYLHEVEQLKAQPAADCGLEVVAWRIGFPHSDGYKVYAQHQPWAYERYGTPPFVTYEVQDLCRLSDATAVIDQLRAENEVLTLRVMAGERQELASIKSAPVVMPERATDTDWLRSNDEYNEGWNDCLDEFERLNRSKTNEQ